MRRSDDEEEGKCVRLEEAKDSFVAEGKAPRLDMAAVAKAERNRCSSSDYSEERAMERLLEGEVVVVFALPDGSEGEGRFKLGHTVLLLKTFVEDEYDIPLASQRLFFRGAEMLDPLSLSDFLSPSSSESPSTVLLVRVDGVLPESASKK
mmetsp:Transcript_5918/g.19230  ORF Transcript_5918/g.19230 Transcript_5918/m.19230 type:complete len:150 (+) Transcript_5918:112-561(+)